MTFDTDYMCESSLQKFLHKYKLFGKATFFCHQYFSVLEQTDHEICPHPIISDLLQWKNSLHKIDAQLTNKPKGIRNHSCVFSHMIGIDLSNLGYVYSSNIDRLFQAEIRPYRHPWGIWELPIYYMDNMDFWMSKNWTEFNHKPFNKKLIARAIEDIESLYVFDLHPLHIALNTRTHEDYSLVKSQVVNQGACPFELRFQGRGTAVFFEELCEQMERSGQKSFTCSEALEHFSRI